MVSESETILQELLEDVLETGEGRTTTSPVPYNAYYSFSSLNFDKADFHFSKIAGGKQSSGSRLGIVRMSPKIVFED